jgi:succinate dehydrogenase/fumarate reductase flavoprotein subunit
VITIKTDVLVIGGGMAGCFAAINAREAGADVILADKGYVGSSGQTPFANTLFLFDPEQDEHDAWMHQINAGGDYLNNRVWTEIVFRDSKAIYENLTEYGVDFLKNEDGTLMQKGMDELGPCTCVFPNEPKTPHSVLLRKKILEAGAQIMDRIMIIDLLTSNGKVTGAIGFTVNDAEPCVFQAKSVIICAGACGFKPAGWPIANLTADGDMMAYRAGAEITGKEFMDVHTVLPDNPAYLGPSFLKRPPGFTPPLPKYKNAEGEVKRMLRFHLAPEFDVHEGKAPVYGRYLAEEPPVDADWPAEMITGASAGMSTHRAEGIWPEGTDCGTGIQGLYAAGDSLGIVLCGAAYSALGIALTGAGVTGAIAGKAAAAFSLNAEEPVCHQAKIDAMFDEIYTPMKRKGGFKPSWVIQLLQNTMIPYYIGIVKKEDRLLAALNQIEFLRDSLVPKLRASDPHELRLAIEVKNMITNAEMRIKASQMRKESRGTHYREDYPDRDDDNWFVWITARLEDSEMILSTKPVPEEWKKPVGDSDLFDFPKAAT